MHPQLLLALAALLSLTFVQPLDIRSMLHRFLYKTIDAEDADAFSETDITMELLSANRSGLPPCDDNKLMLRLAQMQIISPERIVLMVLASGGLVELCRTLRTNIEATTMELRGCAPFERDNLYWLLYRGVGVLFRSLCLQDNEITTKLAIYNQCIRDLREEFVDCEGPADWFEKIDGSICPTFEEIINCQYVKTAELCGLEPANMLRCIAMDVMTGSLPHECNKSMVTPRVENPMPVLVSDGSKHLGSVTMPIILIYFVNVFYSFKHV